MARAWIVDRWVKDAVVMVDGKRVRVPAPASQLRKLSTLDDQYKTDRFGQGRRWQVSWYEIEPTTGKKRLRKLSYAKRSDAEAKRDQLSEDQRVGRYVSPENARKPFRDAGEAWLKSRHKISNSTRDNYRRILDTIVYPRWGHVPLEAINRPDVDQWVADMIAGNHPVKFKPRKDGTPRKARPIAPTRLKSIISVVFGGSLRYAVSQKWIAASPAEGVERPAATARKKMLLTMPEVEAIAQAARTLGGADAERDYTMVQTFAYSAMRVSECCALRCGDVDGTTLHVIHNFATRDDGTLEEVEPKHGEKRDIVVPQFVADLLALLVKDHDPDAYVFRDAQGGHLYPSNVRDRIITPAAIGAGFEPGLVTPHVFRHFAASAAIAAGADVLVVQKMLGHKDAQTTLNIYGHMFPNRLGEVAQALDKARQKALRSAAIIPKSSPKPVEPAPGQDDESPTPQ